MHDCYNNHSSNLQWQYTLDAFVRGMIGTPHGIDFFFCFLVSFQSFGCTLASARQDLLEQLAACVLAIRSSGVFRPSTANHKNE